MIEIMALIYVAAMLNDLLWLMATHQPRGFMEHAVIAAVSVIWPITMIGTASTWTLDRLKSRVKRSSERTRQFPRRGSR